MRTYFLLVGVFMFVLSGSYIFAGDCNPCPDGCVEQTICPDGCTAEPAPMIEIMPNVFFEGAEGNDYGSLYFRTKRLGYDLLVNFYAQLREVEGVSYISPNPYHVSIGKTKIYTWEEVLEGVKRVIEDAIATAAKMDEATGGKIGM